MTVGLSPEIVALRMAFPDFAESNQFAMLHSTVRTITVEKQFRTEPKRIFVPLKTGHR
jgi:hypothetical protein